MCGNAGRLAFILKKNHVMPNPTFLLAGLSCTVISRCKVAKESRDSAKNHMTILRARDLFGAFLLVEKNHMTKCYIT